MGRREAAGRIERFVAGIDAKLRADESSTKAMRVVTDSSLRRVLTSCGFERRGSRNLEAITAALAAVGVCADPPLATPGLDWDARIYFKRTPPVRASGVQTARFPAERDLEDFLVANFDYLFPGLDLVGRQYRVTSGQVDLLARDRDGYVVIELKLDEPSDNLIFQVDRYMDDVATWVAGHGGTESVRGLVIAGQDDETMRAGLETLAGADRRRIDWMTYRVDFTLRPVERTEP